MMLLAIDPGPAESAWLLYDHGKPIMWRKNPNESVLSVIHDPPVPYGEGLAVEMIASYGMAVGAEVFETCVWIGRFIQCYGMRWYPEGLPEARRLFRSQVKMRLCGNMRAKDANVRQALIDRYGPGRDKAIGRKASPGPLYGMSGDCWAALGVAVTASVMPARPFE